MAIATVNALPINPIRTRIQHVNVQVATLDDMVTSYQRIKEIGFKMALAVGQHTNDKELSYYAMTPLGLRMGGGLEPDRRQRSHLATHHPPGHQHLGAHPEGQTVIDKLEQFAVAARSLFHDEDTIAAFSAPAILDD